MSDSERLHKFNLLQRNQGRTKEKGKDRSAQKQKSAEAEGGGSWA